MVSLTIEGVTKRFDSVTALDGVSLEIPHGRFFTILGPSGCGKTTLLRVVAGFELPDAGRVIMEGSDITLVPPHKRGMGMVFQNYALWPHMKVRDNVAYGLRVRGLPKAEVARRVMEALRLVGLEGLEDRFPSQLSGGQQQRVALARALAIEPKVLLLDEPLSNLDAKLRVEVRAELKALQRRLGITTLYVTHDQEEAFAISDLVAIINRGRIEQVGAPREIYTNPANRFVASFIGESTFFEGLVRREGPHLILTTREGLTITLPRGHEGLTPGAPALVAVRPEAFTLTPSTPEDNVIEGTVVHVAFMGNYQKVHLDCGGLRVVAMVPPSVGLSGGERCRLFFSPDAVVHIPA